MDSNICKFIPNKKETESINILNFVYEKEKKDGTVLQFETAYRMHLVIKGSGKFCLPGSCYGLKSGDIFFTFPSEQYTVQSAENFEYMYISFIGTRANHLMDNFNITKKNFLFNGFESLVPIWENSISGDCPVLGIKCEGLLLYTFSMLADRLILINSCSENTDAVLYIKKFIDDNFSEKTISLDMISDKYSYNKKYISHMFKKKFKIGISQYIKTLRIQKAIALMDQGFTSVKDISNQCGFEDQFYFSRVFKEKTGISPKQYIANTHKSE